MGRFRSIQILRGWAALLVLWHHACLPLVHHFDLTWIFPAGFRLSGMFGVDVFFVISGFVITKSAFGGKRISASDFLKRRLLRIAPLYWLMTLPWISIVRVSGPLDWRRIAASLTFWPAYDRMVLPILGVGWSLCFEMLFYGLATTVLWANRSKRLLVGIVVAYLAIASLRLVHNSPVLAFLGNGMVLEFVAGAALALWHKGGALSPRAGMVAVASGLAVWLGFSPTLDWAGFAGLVDAESGHLDWVRAGIFGPAAALIVWGGLQLEAFVAGRRWNWPVYLGAASFAIYLTHTLALFVGGYIAGSVPNAWGLPYMLADMAVALAASVLVYEIMERKLATALKRLAPVPVPAPQPA